MVSESIELRSEVDRLRERLAEVTRERDRLSVRLNDVDADVAQAIHHADLEIGEADEFGRKQLARAIAAEEALAKEREACARIAETQYRADPDGIDAGCDPWLVRKRVQERIAARIRKGGV